MTIDHTSNDIEKSLVPNKAHGYDTISIHMIKSLHKPLLSKCCSVHKKGDKQILKNYRPILFLPIRCKIFEWLLYNQMFRLCTESEQFHQINWVSNC